MLYFIKHTSILSLLIGLTWGWDSYLDHAKQPLVDLDFLYKSVMDKIREDLQSNGGKFVWSICDERTADQMDIFATHKRGSWLQ